MGNTRANHGAYLMRCRVRHTRLRPVQHGFSYPLFMVRVALDQLEQSNTAMLRINGPGILSVRMRDYGPRDGRDAQAWLRVQLEKVGIRADGRIWLQTMPRILGYVFNPVSFFLCEDAQGRLMALYADVNNTFGEHHGYLLAAENGGPIAENTPLVCRKAMHVSPFCKVEGTYHFRVRESAGHNMIGIDYHDSDGLLIRTVLVGKPYPLIGRALALAVLRQPLMTLAVVWRIHWQALRLWIRKVPYIRKPIPSAVAVSSNLLRNA